MRVEWTKVAYDQRIVIFFLNSRTLEEVHREVKLSSTGSLPSGIRGFLPFRRSVVLAGHKGLLCTLVLLLDLSYDRV